MIAYIKGKLVQILDEAVIVDVQGIGYEIFCANPFAFQDSFGKEVQIDTYHHVREDAHILYGFKKAAEKYLFTKLISVSGIGPKGALGILSSVDAAGFAAAIEREDEKFLTGFPGVGKKTARQMILDLKGKLTDLVVSQQDMPVDEPKDYDRPDNNTLLDEACEALRALGYSEKELRSIRPELQKEKSAGTDELIRKALSLLMKNR
ncbi:Holliday junction branch migration protein RuvA [Virgibacillus xinjiangensis]|uniref:Holliday junction branch migration complex subunit RuvA n=1 Tax=Virgibacillus xinjiangensis TaxID=393090 RepID=A0ABV7CSA1_9BACI